jgi:hypothetical protein
VKPKQQESTDYWVAPFQPLIDITNINIKATQKFAELQSNFMTYLLEANLKQFQALVSSKDVKSAMERQLEFVKEVDTKWCDTAEEEIETARDVQQSINGILEKNIHNPDFVELFNKDLSKH